MNPKEKAIDLFNKYFDLVEAYSAEQQHDNARTAAFVAVDEVLNALQEHSWKNDLLIEYYLEVNNELNKL